MISLGTLDSQGYKYFAKGGALKVLYGAPVVIKGKLINGLYLVQGSIVFGVASVSSSDLDLDITCLWHMHLVNISEKGVLILNNQGLLDIWS